MTSTTVAVQEDPCRGCTSMEHPTTWAGRVSGRSAGGAPAAPGKPGRMPAGEGPVQGGSLIDWRSARCVCCGKVALNPLE